MLDTELISMQSCVVLLLTVAFNVAIVLSGSGSWHRTLFNLQPVEMVLPALHNCLILRGEGLA